MKKNVVLGVLVIIGLVISIGVGLSLKERDRSRDNSSFSPVSEKIPDEFDCVLALGLPHEETRDLNLSYDHEPCWQELRQEIAQCLKARKEVVTEERIQVILEKHGTPEHYQELRRACNDKLVGSARQECLSKYEQYCKSKQDVKK